MRRLVPLPPSKCLSPHSVYSGHQSVLVPPLELESNVSLWLSAVSQYKARVTFCSYSVMEMCTKGLGAQTGALRVKCKNQRWGVGGAIQLQGSSKPSHLFPNQRGGYLRGQGRGGRGLRVSSSASVLRTPRVKTELEEVGLCSNLPLCTQISSQTLWASHRHPSLRQSAQAQRGPDCVCCGMISCSSADEGREPVVCAHMHGSGRGAAPNLVNTVIFQAIQRPGPPCTRCEHHLWVQG